MATPRILTTMALSAAVLLSAMPAQALTVATGSPDKTLSPYFMVQGSDGETDRLPLKETRADVDISGIIARVKVTQTYKNEGKSPLEAIYVFPGSTRSAVFAMRMKIGERSIEAKIEEKQKARQMYEAAKSAGKSASLLEQNRPNVFTMSVANILPGDTVKVELDYVEALVPTDGVYEFSYPTVVGPRYSEKKASEHPGEKWISNPHLSAGVSAPYKWDIDINLNAGMPVSGVRSQSHQIQPSFVNPSRVKIGVNDPAGGNRDFVLRYRLSGNKIATGLLTYPGKNENFFLAMIQPPKRVKLAERPAREYIFIIDVSGSMRGFPLDISKKIMRGLLSGMNSRDRFNIMFFSGGNWTLSNKSLPVTAANIASAMNSVDRQRGGGGTRIRQAMDKALKMPRSRNMSTSFVVLTDGYVSVEKETFDLIRNNLGEANLFSFGIGSSVNRFLIDGMARAGMGEPFIALNPTEAVATADKFLKYVESPVLTNVRVKFDGMRAYDVVPKHIPDVFAQRPILVFGKYRGKAGKVRVTGTNGRGKFKAAVAANTNASKQNSALRYLWARHQIQELSDYQRVARNSERQKEITSLGLTYNLMTDYTSFIAIDNKVRNKSGHSTTVRQALPMPQSVSNSAIGGGLSGPRRSYRGRKHKRRHHRPAPRTQARSGGSYGGLLGGKGYGSAGGRSSLKLKSAAPAEAAEMSADEDRKEGADSRRVLRRHQLRLVRSLRAKGVPSGLRVRIRIGADGKVKSVKVLASTLSAKDLKKALAIIKRYRFPRNVASWVLVL